ncbi:UDP-2,4-diacetamido-2,4,6-trideoxy-beta-L-altropyranose hydrolase [Desulfatibacillum alkenivorans]|nr:UDP-2,4-diacetamido-2,4,6-trideoxy-beta-L-altropyranose hydrolase [Desulfatibacillum alkenivorans]
MNLNEKQPLLIIRADAGPNMGTGHVMRCIGLAQAWESLGGKAEFACTGAPLARLAEEGLPVNAIRSLRGSMDDAHETAALLKSKQAVWAALDGYHFTADFQKLLMDQGIKTLVVDDNQDCRFYHANIVVNPNLHAKEKMFRDREVHTRLLLGPEYAFLRKEFWESSKMQRRPPQKAANILITLGGADPHNTTLKAIRAVKLNTGFNLHAKVLAGQSNPHIQSLEEELKDAPGVELIRDAKNMAELMAWADFAVSAAGSTCWEMAASGLPGIYIVLADNQKNIAAELHGRGAGINLGWRAGVTKFTIWGTIKHLMEFKDRLERMSKAGQAITDGLGAKRTVNIMMEQ